MIWLLLILKFSDARSPHQATGSSVEFLASHSSSDIVNLDAATSLGYFLYTVSSSHGSPVNSPPVDLTTKGISSPVLFSYAVSATPNMDSHSSSSSGRSRSARVSGSERAL